MGAHVAQPDDEGLARLGVGGQRARRRAQRLHAVAEHRLQQPPAGREVPVQGGGPDPGAPRDVLRGDLGAVLGHGLPGSGRDAVAAALRVRPEDTTDLATWAATTSGRPAG